MVDAFKKYGKTGQFRNVVRSINDEVRGCYDKDKDEWSYDEAISLPKLVFHGTVKAHGTNTSITFCDGEIITAGRNKIVVVGDDNYGFSAWANKPEVKQDLFDIVGNQNNIILYGEWCGAGIRKGVAITGLDKMWIVFAARECGDDGDGGRWIDIKNLPYNNEAGIYNVNQFGAYSVEIDFNNPQMSSPQLSSLVDKIEAECPIGKHFGVSGIGEGAVFSHFLGGKRFVFKVKGQKHSVSKTKTLAPVDVEKLISINEFVDYSVTESRLEQGAGEVLNGDFDRKNLGKFIKWMSTDIKKEESDVLESNGLSMKDVGGGIAKASKAWFFENE